MRIHLAWWLGALFVVPFALSFLPGVPVHGFGHVWLGLPLLFWFRNPGHRRRLALYVAGIVLQTLAYPEPDLGWLGWVLLWPYLLARESADGARWWRAAYLYGFLRAFAGYHWLGHVHYAAWVGTSIGSALLFACVFEGLLRLGRAFPYALRVAVAWVAYEWIHSWFLGGLPWLFLAHTQYRYLPVIQAADLVGAYGISFLLAFVQAALLDGLRRRGGPIQPLAAGLVLAAALVYGLVRAGPEGDPGPQVLMVQSAFPHYVKESGSMSRREIARLLLDLTDRGMREHPGTRLIVWPETMHPWGLLESHPAGVQYFGDVSNVVARRYGVPTVYGTNTYVDEERWKARRGHNSAVLIDASGEVAGIYRKQRLVPMGEEFLPRRIFPDAWCDAWFDWLVENLHYLETCDLEAGEGHVTLDAGPGLRGAVLICFEGLYAGLAREAVRAADPDFVLHLVNNGWFGRSWEQRQSVACWVLRAVETRTPFLSCANGGITCAVDARGRIVGRLDRVMEPGLLAVRVPPRGRPPLLLRAGPWPGVGALALLLALLGLRGRRRGARGGPEGRGGAPRGGTGSS